MSQGYLVVKCDTCGSTAQLMTERVRSDEFLCPVCLEGEIEYKTRHPGTKKGQIIFDGVENLGQYITTPIKLSTN